MMKTNLQALTLFVVALAAVSRISELCQDIDAFNEANKAMWQNQPLEKVYGESEVLIERERDGPTKAISWTFEDQSEKLVFVKRIVSESREDDDRLARYIRNLFILEEEPRAVKIIACVEKTLEINQQVGTEATPIYQKKSTSAVFIITESFYGAFDERQINRNSLKVLQHKNSVFALRVFLGMAQSIQALHSRKLIHGHIRPSSFVAKDSKLAQIKMWNLQYADTQGSKFFGNSTIFTPFLSNASNSVLSPEIDIYAFAMTLASIEIGDHWLAKVVSNTPKKNRTVFLQRLRTFILINLRKIRNYRRIGQLKDGLTDIIRDCLDPNPASRPNIDRLVNRLTTVVQYKEKERADKALLGKTESNLLENDRQFTVTMSEDSGLSVLGEAQPVDKSIDDTKGLIRQTAFYAYVWGGLAALLVAGVILIILFR